MIKPNIIIVAGIILMALAFFALAPGHKTSHKGGSDMLAVVVEPFEIRDGWGYKVNIDGRTYIYQDVIPGVPGNRVFRSKENALRVGRVVAEKLTHHTIPAMSQQELIDMKILEAR